MTRSRPAEAGPDDVMPDPDGAERLLDLDEDALAGALLGRLDGRILHTARDVGQALGPTRAGEDLCTLLHVGQPIVEQGEDGGRDLFTESVAGAEILIDPDLHCGPILYIE